MKAVILAGGLGSRLKSVVNDIPKPMADVQGKPFLEYLLLQLKKWKIKEIIILIGYKAEYIKQYFKDGKLFGVNISYSEEKELLETGGALKQAQNLLNDNNEYFILMNGDSFFNIDFNELIKMQKNKNAFGVISMFKSKNSVRYGNIRISKDNKIIEFVEKKKRISEQTEQLANGGIYLFHKKIFDYIPLKKSSLEIEIFPELIKKEKLYGKIFNGYFIDIGIPEDYKKINNTKKFLNYFF
ncbi:MAG TPA: nucleotidyltransferase family protein [bacterium]|nr:nucleotidyltransferase family protein [bacterium]